MLTLKQWDENKQMYTIKNEQGKSIGTFRYETREEYNSILTVYTDSRNPLNAELLIRLGEFIQKSFGKSTTFGLLTSDLIYNN